MARLSLLDFESLQATAERAISRLRATAVIVLYGMSANESPAFASLIEARRQFLGGEGAIPIILWDNSSMPQVQTQPAENVEYFHDPRNPGLAPVFNRMIEIADQHGSQWLITLDQDSAVPPEYLRLLEDAARLCAARSGIGAIVPQIAMGSKQLSPCNFALGSIPRWYRTGFCGIPDHAVFAFNSGAMLNLDALRQIDGYDQRFPIEYSDTAMFRRLHKHGKRVYIEGRIQLRHEFSLIEMDRVLSEERYRRTLLAETAFWDLYMNWMAGCERTARLALRMVRHWKRGDRRELRRVTLQFLGWRLFRSKKTRLRKWRESLAQHTPATASFPSFAPSRPKVSVCMAAYNGTRFIEAQIASILLQLAPDDEIVIVDDRSQDDTVERVMAIRDPRIRLYRHERNEGVVATFEDALRSATGKILFLSDDDDLWAPTKVERVLQEFEAHPEAQVVASRVALIDERDAALPDARVNRYGRFVPGFWRNIFKNHYQGSAMAIRASFLGEVLPFPRGKLFLHDAWIGTRNEARGGKTVFIDEPLVYYRRHLQNASQRHSLMRLVKLRIHLLIAHMVHAL